MDDCSWGIFRFSERYDDCYAEDENRDEFHVEDFWVVEGLVGGWVEDGWGVIYL